MASKKIQIDVETKRDELNYWKQQVAQLEAAKNQLLGMIRNWESILDGGSEDVAKSTGTKSRKK